MVYIRRSVPHTVHFHSINTLCRSFFAKKFRHIIEASLSGELSRGAQYPVKVRFVPWWQRAARSLLGRKHSTVKDVNDSSSSSVNESSRNQASRLRTDMIRRMDDAPRLVNPSGWISEGRSEPNTARHRNGDAHAPDMQSPLRFLAFADIDNSDLTSSAEPQSQIVAEPEVLSDPESDSALERDSTEEDRHHDLNQASHRAIPPRVSSRGHLMEIPVSDEHPRPIPRSDSINVAGRHPTVPRTQTVEFAATPRPLRHMHSTDHEMRQQSRAYTTDTTGTDIYAHDRRSMRRPTVSISQSIGSHSSTPRPVSYTLHRDFGGFPMPHEIASNLVRRYFPQLERKFTRTITMPRTRTIASQHGTVAPGTRPVPYISFEAVVDRNSAFKRLTNEQLEELGGIEYRALSALLWIVGGYHVISQLLAFVVIAPYMSISRWSNDFRPPILHRSVSPVWYSAFQVVSAYTNSGMSLQDQSMVPFQEAYPMIVFMIFLILAGNTAFPVFLRLTIWILTKMVPQRSRANETLHFLLDHPRRCFIYLFPSHQTWFLVTVLFALNATDWFFFEILDLSNPAITSIPTGVRVIIGLLQATAVRAAGFGTVSLSALAPAVKVLYVIMMYVSVYPIAMSVRSTNVYEEKSLGVFDDDESVDEEYFNPTGNRVTVWSRYLAMHMRKQLSFDMWWLGLASFLVCIIERDGLEDEANATWFNIFRIIFELVSAYGTVGLSLGVPYANYSFSGALRPLSKVIICAVMLRGRHRGLPVAIDRAVMLPFEFKESSHYQTSGAEEDNDFTRTETVNGSVRNGDAGDLKEKGLIGGSQPRRRSTFQPVGRQETTAHENKADEMRRQGSTVRDEEG
ncbi:hypothetical protein AcW1_003472 [Taiwanofungus camphoratus]|nr:hypothetical protein AcW1_003472 [Antrodia cinnamomea]